MLNLTAKNIYQLFIILLSLISSTLAQAKFDLPPLKTDAQKISFLLQVRQQLPKLFADAAKYDVDLFTLLDNEVELIELLQKNHVNFDKLYAAKKYIKMTVEPTADIWLGQAEIDPKAIEDWKNSLHQKIKDAKDLVKFEDLPGDTQKMLDLDPVALLNTFGMVDKKDKKSLNYFKKQNAMLLPCKKAKYLHEKYQCIFDSYEALSGLPNLVPKEEIYRIIKAILDEEDILPKLHLAIIKSYKQVKNGQNLTDTVATLNSQDLLFLSDNDGLKPLLLPFFNDNEVDPRFILTLNRIHKELEALSKRTISEAKKISSGIELIEIPPTVGIFRGCIGGDCSSQYSFPYPNDPHERVFLIKKLKPGLKEDDNDQLKGYVSATEVMVNGEPALYVITISGVNVSAADTELILRGLDEAKEQLGVKLIVLPAPEKLYDLINFPAIQGVYEKYLNKNSDRIAIEYQNPDIRNEIQNFRPHSGYNRARYDHMNNNVNGTMLSFNSDKNVSITMTSIKRVQNDASLLLDPDNIFDFIYELNKSKRTHITQKILKIDEIVKLFGEGSAEEIDIFFRIINADSSSEIQEKMKISEFREYIRDTLKNLNCTNTYIENFITLKHLGYLFCEDSFSKNSIEEIAGFFSGFFSKSNRNIQSAILKARLIENRIELFETKEFARLTTLFYENLDSENIQIFTRALNFFASAPTIDDRTYQKLISIITCSKANPAYQPHQERAARTLLKRLIDENEIKQLLRILAANFPQTANEIVHNDFVIKDLIKLLIEADEQECLKILKVFETLGANNDRVIKVLLQSSSMAANEEQQNLKIIRLLEIRGANIIGVVKRLNPYNDIAIEALIDRSANADEQEIKKTNGVLEARGANKPTVINSSLIKCIKNLRIFPSINTSDRYDLKITGNLPTLDATNPSVVIKPMIEWLNERDSTKRLAVIRELKYIMAKHPEVVEEAMDYFKQHVDYKFDVTAMMLFGDNYYTFFARSADCNLL